MKSLNLIIIAASLLLLAACQSGGNKGSSAIRAERFVPEANGDFFQKVSPANGINFKHSIGDDHLDNLVETVGGGAAFLDFDQDGYMDLYMTSGSFTEKLSKGDVPEGEQVNRLYRNQQDGTFEDVSSKAGVDHGGYGMGLTVGDIDNDGYPDIYVTCYGPNVLYHNNGDGTFTDISERPPG